MNTFEYQEITAKVIKDSMYKKTRLITIEATYPKFLQAELNTHRMLVKNAASARAIPTDSFAKMLFVPQRVGINKSGMSADKYLSAEELKHFQQDWIKAFNDSLANVNELKINYNAHKQLINRIIEPFNMTKGVFTATLDSWEHVLGLRNHQDAQPEIQELASLIQEAIKNSVPQMLNFGEWHLPYIDSVESSDDKNIKISASCIAQVSYRKLDDTNEKALAIFNKLNLLSNDPKVKKHISPVQHICQALDCLEINDELYDKFFNEDKKYYAEMGNSFIQVSKFIENDNLLSIPVSKISE